MQKSLGTMDIDGEKTGWRERGETSHCGAYVSAFFCVITVRVEKRNRFNSQGGIAL